MIEGCQILDFDWRYLYVNPAAEVHNQRRKEELLGRTYTESWPGIESTVVYDRIRRCLVERQAFRWQNEFEFPNGSRGWFELRIEPVPEGVLILSADVTERQQSESRLRQTLADLERSNRDLEQFAYVASHDLQEPLRMVASYTDLLASRIANRLDDDEREFLSYATDGAHRMERMIDGLLEFSRVATRNEPSVAVATAEALDEALALLRGAIRDSGAEISRGELPAVQGTRPQIVQLFQNLLGNAIKFRRPHAAPRIAIGAVPAEDQAGFWRFSVADDGIGIEARHIPRLFVIFQRLHGRHEYPGSGLGLALCKRIVERYGGRIGIDSQAGEGTTVWFTLPGAAPIRRAPS